MLYPKNEEKELSSELFKNPTSEYRAAPFWAWNCELKKDVLLRQIDLFKEMGMGGYHIHARNGLATEYLGSEFMELVKACNEEGKANDMLTWLYDEDRYPSGAAGGKVTKNREYSLKYLLFTPYEYGKAPEDEDLTLLFSSPRQENGKLLAKYSIELDDEGYLVSYKKLGKEKSQAENIWYAYLETAPSSTWFNMQTYIDAMNKEAVEKFIESTHEKYYDALGDDFGGSITAIFTDEPQMDSRGRLSFSLSKKDVTMPCTKDFGSSFKKEYGYDYLDFLPELFWEMEDDKKSQFRYHYHKHTTERFYKAFFKPIGSWCREHNISFTGHLMSEQSLLGQYLRLGEAMVHYNEFQLPGIDILSDNHEYTTLKQCQSVVRQQGKCGMISELDGVTNWDYDFRGHKLQGDWQAAMGVTVRVPHLAWVSMEGEAKRDYPASIGYQSPWYKEYNIVEDHFARIASALTRGKSNVKVAVIHPIESYWLCSGPQDKTKDACDEMDKNFATLCEWLLSGQIDFDYISESLLPMQKVVTQSSLKVGAMEYDAVIVSDCVTLRKTTLDILNKFKNWGGKLIFTGYIADHVDAAISDEVKKLAEQSINIPFSKTAILKALSEQRIIDIRNDTGSRTDNLLFQLRDDNECSWLFIAHLNNPDNKDIPVAQKIQITVKGEWDICFYDTITGDISPVKYEIIKGKTVINHSLNLQDSLLYKLTEYSKSDIIEKTNEAAIKKNLTEIDVQDIVPVKLSEPNVMILDMAEYAFDDEQWQKREEILRIDAKLRDALGFPSRGGRLVQPYILKEDENDKHIIKLRFEIKSEVYVKEPMLALEHPETSKVFLNGEPVQKKECGYFVDESIKKIILPPILEGKSLLEVHVMITKRQGAEWVYLLGDFGVKTAGSRSIITSPVRELAFGDWTHQGLPFYAGNVTYVFEAESKGDMLEISASHFRNPVLRVDVDGKKQGLIAFAPYSVLTDVKPGKHTVKITAYGNRHNAFGAIHNSDEKEFFFGPSAWRTEGDLWSYEYRLKPIGIMVKPKLRG